MNAFTNKLSKLQKVYVAYKKSDAMHTISYMPIPYAMHPKFKSSLFRGITTKY